ncbi:MAG: polysaccharide pyruvyl transferase family protein [Alphaproteobacteria bacterium]|nr:polysaccharide pyruvyl transferase family protein [Alphaproteobacteria bacterium]
MSTNQNRKLRIGLYVAVPSGIENRPLRRGRYGALKSAIARARDRTYWYALRQPKVSFYHWNTLLGSNKGDAAIRETIKHSLQHTLAPWELTFDELEWGTLSAQSPEELNRRWDMLVIGGSGYIASNEKGELAKRMLDDLPLLRNLTCLKILYGIGWNSLLTADGEVQPLSVQANKTLREILATMDVLSVRDRASEMLVQNNSKKHVYLTGDPALFYSAEEAYPPLPRVSGELHVGLNFAVHGPETAEQFEANFDQYCALLKSIDEVFSPTFHYIQHFHVERLVPEVLHKRGFDVVSHDPTPRQLVPLYRQLDLHICEMMHSSILAINAGTPTINLAYDIKNIGFFELMDLERFCHPVWMLGHDTILQSVTDAVQNAPQIRRAIEKRKAELHLVYEGFLNEIRSAVSRSLNSAG